MSMNNPAAQIRCLLFAGSTKALWQGDGFATQLLRVACLRYNDAAATSTNSTTDLYYSPYLYEVG